MEKIQVKIQNLILVGNADANFRGYGDLMHKNQRMIVDAGKNCHIIKKYCMVDFATYFNCLQLESWKTKTYGEKFFLNLDFSGKATVEIFGFYKNSKNVNRELLLRQSLASKERTQATIPLPETDSILLGFEITALEDFSLYGGSYSTEVEAAHVRDIYISIASTTFKKESYIKKNIANLKRDVLCEGSELKDHIFVNIVDNGRTLNPAELECPGIKIHPNANVGGSGGYARGMMESLKMPKRPTHVLLMDDDILLMSESLFRTYFLLRILRPEFENHFVSGAMFDYDNRETQYEDVGYVHIEEGSYGPLKDRMDMRWLDNLLRNEEMAKRQQSHCYAGWWFCCIPTTAIEKNGLPLPLFVRGDDVEFSLRNHAQFLTMNGISVWHVGFAGKFNAAMELYQVHRNSLIIQAASGICQDVDFLARLKPMFWKEITRFSYNNASQILDSIEDYLKGPQFLETLNGEASIKAHGALNDKLIPFQNMPAAYDLNNADPYSYKRMNKLQKLIYIATINGHLVPNFMLRGWPEVIAFDWFFVPGKNFWRKKLIAVNPFERSACERTINRKRCFALIKRYVGVMRNYKKNRAAVEQAYREAFSTMVSNKFWEEYLHL